MIRTVHRERMRVSGRLSGELNWKDDNPWPLQNGVTCLLAPEQAGLIQGSLWDRQPISQSYTHAQYLGDSHRSLCGSTWMTRSMPRK